MKKLLVVSLLLVVGIAGSVLAQEATLNTPITRSSETKIVVTDVKLSRQPAQAVIEVTYQDASSVDIRTVVYTIPSASAPSATVVGLITAMMTVRATETGNNVRKMNFRVLGYLADQNVLTGVTLVP